MTWNVQVATWTSNNRYPAVFRTIQARVAQKFGPDLAGARLKILSFGCSTGSEISTLRCYFPEAQIFGCDVNRKALHEASENLLMDEAVLFESSPHALRVHGPYDVVLAMSVLCRFPESMKPTIENLGSLYAFAQFENTIGQLAENLRDGGIICLYNTNYDFTQTRAASAFRPLHSPLLANNGFVDKFDASGARLTWCEKRGPFYVHRPRDPAAATAANFTDCMFEKAVSGAPAPFGHGVVEIASEPPGSAQLFRFGPDLPRCASEGLIATALGYWFVDQGDATRILRAWHRTEATGGISRGPVWAVPGDAEAAARLAAPRVSWPASPVPPPPSFRRILWAANKRLRARIPPKWLPAGQG